MLSHQRFPLRLLHLQVVVASRLKRLPLLTSIRRNWSPAAFVVHNSRPIGSSFQPSTVPCASNWPSSTPFSNSLTSSPTNASTIMSATKRSTSSGGRKSKSSTGRTSKKAKGDDESDIPHLDKQYAPDWMNIRRTRVLTALTSPQATLLKPKSSSKNECVLYWMQRDVRTVDNWALLLARHLANERGVPLRVVYTLPPPPSSDVSPSMSSSSSLPPKVYDMPMTQRHATFMLRGLRLVEKELHAANIPLHILKPESRSEVGRCLHQFATASPPSIDDDEDDTGATAVVDALAVVCDFSPLRHAREWAEDQAAPLLAEGGIPLIQVDAHNVVPVWCASPKKEVGARTLRPRINRLLPEFLTDYPELGTQLGDDKNTNHLPPLEPPTTSFEKCAEYLRMDRSVPPVDNFRAGHKSAMKRFSSFLFSTPSPDAKNAVSEGLKTFDTHRNDPNYQNVCSNLSPWINHGHVSFQRLALLVKAHNKYPNGTAAFLEEGIVRRELSDNFCYYQREDYDELESAAGWAQESLELHTADEREYIYNLKEFVEGKTHDDLWNAAQTQLVKEGKMHGFLRMYWAKKILEWTASPAIALRTGLYLNDRYALDGNNPNGFVGVGWSTMGIHDMGWKERPIFGKIRFMNYAGCKRKFKVADFVARYPGAETNAARALGKSGEVAAKGATSKKRKR